MKMKLQNTKTKSVGVLPVGDPLHKRNTQAGITLVALIITVIVLLILAMVSIRLIMNGGIIGKAEYGTENYKSEEELEKIKLAVASAKLAGNGFLTEENLNTELQKVFNDSKTVNKNDDYYTYNTDKNYKIYGDGKVKEGIVDYVYNGLILHLDAINNTLDGHNSNSTTWYDLSGNNKNATLYNCTINDNCIEFNGTSSYGTLPLGSLGNWGQATTIEVFAKVDNQCIIIADKPSDSFRAIATRETANKLAQCTIRDNDPVQNMFNSPINVIGNNILYSFVWDGSNYSNTKAYTNSLISNKLSETGGYSNSQAEYVTIGRRFYHAGGTWSMKGKIYSIRVYNRELTQEEINNNYNVDIKRFNLN